IGPRSTEVEVVYCEPGSAEKSKATLQALLDRIEKHVAVRKVEHRCADPRAELRGTVNTIANTVSQMVELAAMLADVRAMQALRDIILEELRSVDEALAARVISKLRSHLVVGGVPYGSGVADAGNRGGGQRV